MKKYPRHIFFFLFWPFIASIISFWFQLDIFYSSLTFLAVPAVYLSFLLPKMVKKVAIFSILSTVPFSITIDYIAHYTNQWQVLNGPFPRFLGYVSIEDVIWVVFFSFFAIMFYEYFIDFSRKRNIWNPRMKILAGFTWGLFLLFLALYFFFPTALNIPYFYLVAGLLFLVTPSIVELLRRPKLLSKFILVIFYFFFFALIYELTALKLGQWTFPGNQYIGWVQIFGLQFPFEELFFGFLFYSTIVLVCYEAFDDDEK